MSDIWSYIDGATPAVRQPIATAPKDGRFVLVSHPDVGEFKMKWAHIHRDPKYPGVVGMWIMELGEFNWPEAGGRGPIAWRECEQPAWMNYARNGMAA